MAEFNTPPEFAAKRGRGRPPGSPNKVTKAAKDIIAGAADALGGQTRLVTWAKADPANERVFWGQIYPKLLPLQVTGEGGGPLMIAAVEWRVPD